MDELEPRELEESELEEVSGGLTVVVPPIHVNFPGTLQNNGNIIGSFQ